METGGQFGWIDGNILPISTKELILDSWQLSAKLDQGIGFPETTEILCAWPPICGKTHIFSGIHMTKVRTRFSPSPTGALHLGGAHTALFNWLFTRHHGGVFILRIEDTDQERSKEQFVDEIMASLSWMGLDWDEGPFRQSDRFPIYNEFTERLLATGAAYFCDCDPQDLEERRKAALARGEQAPL